jgi:hypothetical protein
MYVIPAKAGIHNKEPADVQYLSLRVIIMLAQPHGNGESSSGPVSPFASVENTGKYYLQQNISDTVEWKTLKEWNEIWLEK